MSDQNTQQEPSMEEILASIRRIISEDGDEQAPPAAAAPAAKPASRPEPPPEAEPEPEPEEDFTDDILELTEEIQDDGSIVDLQADEDEMQGDEPEADEVELEMVDSADEDDIEPEALPEPEPEPVNEPETMTGPMASIAAAVEERLISTPPAAESVSSLASLAAAVDSHRRAVDPSIGPKTIEDLVKEVMRPMIREWLDGNLPGLVERLVTREIQRLTREAEELSER
ncbi:MAG: DUF2497 domain-containing protein [Rhodospirillaceae bacterium]